MRNLRPSAVFTALWTVLRWVFVLVFVFLAFQLIYYFAPDLHEQQLRWLAPGAIVGVVLWLLVSFLFGSYLNLYNTYSVVYGSLGAVIILLLWFYLTGVTILIGGEVNAIIEQAAAAPETQRRRRQARRFRMKTRGHRHELLSLRLCALA